MQPLGQSRERPGLVGRCVANVEQPAAATTQRDAQSQGRHPLGEALSAFGLDATFECFERFGWGPGDDPAQRAQAGGGFAVVDQLGGFAEHLFEIVTGWRDVLFFFWFRLRGGGGGVDSLDAFDADSGKAANDGGVRSDDDPENDFPFPFPNHPTAVASPVA